MDSLMNVPPGPVGRPAPLRRVPVGWIVALVLLLVGLWLWGCVDGEGPPTVAAPSSTPACAAERTRLARLEVTVAWVETLAAEMIPTCGALWDACCAVLTDTPCWPAATATATPAATATATETPERSPTATLEPTPAPVLLEHMCRLCADEPCPDGYECRFCVDAPRCVRAYFPSSDCHIYCGGD